MRTLAYRIGTYSNGACDVFPVILEDGKIIAMSKYPCGPRQRQSVKEMKEELALFVDAANYPPFDENTFTLWDCFLTNGWEDWGAGTMDDRQFQDFIDGFGK